MRLTLFYARRIPAFVLGAVLALTLTACDSAEKNQDTERDQAWFLYLTRNVDVAGACLSSETASFNCANSAGFTLPVYVAFVETTFKVTVASPRGLTEVCTALRNSPSFTSVQYTEGGVICRFKCNQTYWEAKKTAGACTASGYTALVTNALSGQDACLKDCLTKGTVLYEY